MIEGVRIGGVGMTPFGKHRDRRIEDLGRQAVMTALDDAEVDRAEVGEVFCGTGYGGPLVGQRILSQLGMTGPPVTNVENACSSGATAFREAAWAVSAGRTGVALAIGVDQLSRLGGGTVPLDSTDLEAGMGMVMPGLYAMRARRYMHEAGATVDDLARVTVKSRRNGATNPYAHFRKQCEVDEVLSAREIADPLTLPMCSPTSDGAAAAVLVTPERARRGSGAGIRIGASILHSGEYKTGFRDMGRSGLGERTATAAYEQAGLGPADLDVVELHDAFTIAELLYYEAFGLCGRGEAPDLLAKGETKVDGRIPVNTSGGLLSRGHAIGATGIAQICEMVWQLRGQATGRQVDGPKTALTHCSGGGISGFDHGASCIHVLTT